MSHRRQQGDAVAQSESIGGSAMSSIMPEPSTPNQEEEENRLVQGAELPPKRNSLLSAGSTFLSDWCARLFSPPHCSPVFSVLHRAPKAGDGGYDHGRLSPGAAGDRLGKLSGHFPDPRLTNPERLPSL